MKKLMIAMSAIAAAALVANADPTPIGDIEGFEGRPETALDVEMNDEGGTTEPLLWSRAPEKTGESIVKAYETAPEKGGKKYLYVDESDVLTRSAAKTTMLVGTNVTVSTMVQFTAADEAPTASNGDKLLVWMQAAAEAVGTEGAEGYVPAKKDGVMVTDKNGTTMIKEIVPAEGKELADAVKAYLDAWHTLEIKAVADGADLTATAKFTVKLDGETYAKEFDSMVTGGDTAQTISSIGFKGTGAVDDIAFAWEKAEASTPLTVEAENITAVTYKVDGEGEAITYVEGATFPTSATTLVFAVTPATGYVVKSAMVATPDGDPATLTVQDNTLTLTIADYVTADGIVIAFVAEEDKGGDTPAVDPAAGETEVTVTAADEAAAKAAGLAAITVPEIEGLDAATYRGYFKAEAKAGETEGTFTVTVALDETKVTPEIDAESEELDIAAGAITVAESKVGLYYQLIRGATVDAIENTVASAAGNGETLTLTDAKPLVGAGFYKIAVTPVAPTTKTEE